MSKNKKGSTSKKKKHAEGKSTMEKKAPKQSERVEPDEDDAVITLEALNAMSDSDDDGDGEMPPEEEWNGEARSLKEAIESGIFNKLLRQKKSSRMEGDDESIEEVVLDDDDDSSEGSDMHEREKGGEGENDNEHVEEEKEDDDDDGDKNSNEEETSDILLDSEQSKFPTNQAHDTDNETPGIQGEEEDLEEKPERVDDEDDEEENSKEDEDSASNDEESDQEPISIKELNARNQKSLRSEASQILNRQRQLTWPETFDVVSAAPLPFDHEDEEGNKTDIHDDLKREVAFYNMALEAALQGRQKCNSAGIQFSRPDDFFAEMVKSDEHMAKIKDRLIFESKKIDAVNQRKANKEQKLRSKESQASRLAEKAKRKKDNLKAVDEWARDVASKRSGGQLSNDMDLGTRNSPNKRRLAANKRYGFGGKTGRFKQTDPKALNDMSGFSSKGNFSGGRKRTGGSGGGGVGKRPGKRARDANRARNK